MMKPSFALFLLLMASAHAVDFNRDVRPVLAQQCFTCHGMDDHGRKGKLRLDLPESAHGKGKSGEIAIVPGKPDASEVVKRILSTDEDEVMPPPETNKKLTPSQIETLKRWINEGAEYKKHWSFEPPVKLQPPQIRNPKSEIQNPKSKSKIPQTPSPDFKLKFPKPKILNS
jgi:mono/diheme cytochrome c family protein